MLQWDVIAVTQGNLNRQRRRPIRLPHEDDHQPMVFIVAIIILYPSVIGNNLRSLSRRESGQRDSTSTARDMDTPERDRREERREISKV